MGASSSTSENLGHQLSSDLLLEATRSAEPLGGRYVTTKLEHGRQVVVKVFKDVQSHDVKAFQRRAAALCGLDMHMHLLLPMGWGVAESSCFVVYDQLDQIDAEKRLEVSRRGGKAFLWADRLRLGAAVASAASHLRSCLLGSPHLNLKLSSVVFDRTGQVKLADLGFEGASFEGKGDLQSKKAQAGSLASQQVAELHDLGRLLFELLLPSSEAAKAAVQAAKQLEAVRPSELFQRLGVPGCDASAAWPAAAAHDVAVTALQCVLAEAAGTQPPPGMTNVAGMLLHQCQRSRHVEGASFSSIEVAFDCTFSSQLDVQSLSVERRFWRFPPLGVGHALGPWPVGRQHQVELFVQLVPDRRLCSSIGRTHFELWPLQDAYREGSWFWRTEKQALRLVPLSQNPILVDGKKVAYPSEEEVLIFDGSKVSFSFQDEVFLTLQFLLGHTRIEAAMERAKSEGSVVPEPRESPASYALQCEELLGESVEDFSKEDRRIPLLAEGANFIGRMSHPSYFDKLQRGAPQGRPFLPFVSRRHLQVTASWYDSSEPPNKQRFEVVNWSNNPISVAGHRLGEGQKRQAQVGETIELLGEDGRGGVAPYLIFRLLWLGAGRSNLSLASRSTLLPAGAIFRDRFKETDCLDREPRNAKTRPPFQLILAGTAVVKGLPQSWRVVDGLSTGLTVGRAHQRELHEKALVEGVLEYISRDHFSIKASKDGNFSVVPLSQNPMWHSRGGRLQLLQPGHLPVRLQHADVLVLYTGADDATHPDGPGSHGSLQWIFKITVAP